MNPLDPAGPRFVIRPALPSDRSDVIAFCRLIWEGSDYIPDVWDEWLADPGGEMLVLEHGGHAVGLGRLTRISPGQWWLEGLRVDPACQGKGLGARLHERLVAEWLERGDGSVRLWTNAERRSVQHLCDRLGFIKTQEYSTFSAAPLPGKAAPFEPIGGPADIPAALALVRNSGGLELAGGMIDMGWRLAVPDEHTLGLLLAWQHGHVLWWRDRQGLLCLWEDVDDDGDRYPMIALAVTAPSDLAAMLLDARAYAAARQSHKISWNASLQTDLAAVLGAAGFDREWQGANFQYERCHPVRP